MRRLFILLILLVTLPCSARAASFRAEVDRDRVSAGDSLTLQLTLSGARATDSPDLSSLNRSFDIVSQGQSSSTEIFNGQATTSTGWVLTLVPKEEGQAIIPAITVETDAGSLRSDPVTVEVAHGAPSASAQAAPSPGTPDRSITVSAEVDNNSPYKNQPIHYTVRAFARGEVAGVSLQDPVLDNAIVEKQGQPELRNQTINGRPVHVIVFRYLITPLQPGKLVIPAAILQGQVESAQARTASPFDENSFADPFRMFQALRAMPGFAPMQPFRIGSNDVAVNVAAPPVAMDPWLPLDSLKIKEDFDEKQQTRVGEPITRKVSLLAEGGVASQLPSLEPQQNHTDFKIYADKPDMGNDTDKGSGVSYAWRDESYSLIPTKYGKLTLPAIHVQYWNLKTNSLASADLPAREIDVQPGAPGHAAYTPQAAMPAAVQPASTPAAVPKAAVSTSPAQIPAWLYAVMAVLLAIVVFVVAWAVSMQRQIKRIAAGKASMPAKASAPARMPVRPALDAVQTPQDLNLYLQGFAHERWSLPAHAPLETIFAAWPKPVGAPDDRHALTRDLGAALYANKTADMDDLKRRVRNLIAAIPPESKKQRKGGDKLPDLNPE